MAPVVKREELIVPYIHTPPPPPSSSAGVVGQSMPMAAMFMKNKLLSWFSLISAVQAYLGELHGEPVSEGAQSGLLRLALGIVGLGVCYMELIVPGSSGALKKRAVEEVADAISETIATAAATATN